MPIVQAIPLGEIDVSYLILFLLLCSSCAYEVQELKTGMTRQELIWTFGSPDADDRTTAIEKMRYFNRRLTPLGNGYTGNYYIFLQNDQVTEYRVTRVYRGSVECR